MMGGLQLCRKLTARDSSMDSCSTLSIGAFQACPASVHLCVRARLLASFACAPTRVRMQRKKAKKEGR